jgi:hypothetical protein
LLAFGDAGWGAGADLEELRLHDVEELGVLVEIPSVRVRYAYHVYLILHLCEDVGHFGIG